MSAAHAMTLREFGVVFGKLAMQLRAMDADEATIRSYFEPLADLPLDAVRMAQEAFAREAGRQWLPTSAEWRERALEAQQALLRKALPSGREEPWHLECESCEDTGCVFGLECDGGAAQWPEQLPKEPRGAQGPQFPGNKRPVGYVGNRTGKPGRPTCGKPEPHLPHSYTKPCGCRATNRTYLRHHHFGAGL